MTASLFFAGLSTFARRVLGVRVAHLYAAALAAVVLVAVLAPPFWWLGEQAYNAAGVAGVLLVLASYLACAAVALVAFGALLARLAIGRVRRTLRPR